MIHFTFRRKKEIKLTSEDCVQRLIITPIKLQEESCEEVDATEAEAEVTVVVLATSVPQKSCFTFAMTMTIIELD